MSIADYGFAIWETFYVTILSTAFALVLGLPLGVLLVAGDKDGVLPLPGWLMHVLNIVINILRSVPFLILMIATLLCITYIPAISMLLPNLMGYASIVKSFSRRW